MRTLGIDFGERRIGLALSDPEGRWALPWQVVERTSDHDAVGRILALIEQEGVRALVVGEPRNPADGSLSPGARRARAFGERLARASGLPVEWIDETLTTVEADERLRAAGTRGAGREAARDALAAQILLQEALDRRLSRSGS